MKDILHTMEYSSLFGQDNGYGWIEFERNDVSFLKLKYSEQNFSVKKFLKKRIIF